MGRIRMALACAIVVSACTSEAAPITSTSTAATTTSTPSTSTSTTQAAQTSSSTTTPPNPLTERAIRPDVLALMPLVDLPAPFGIFASGPVLPEGNAAAARRAAERADETDDIERFGRVDGYRTVHQAGALVARTATSVDTWVALFETDDGASGYLGDFADDVIKGIDVGHGGALRVIEASDFVVDELGDEAVGIMAAERTAAFDDGFYETIIGFRIGRVLGFVSIVRETDADARILALRIANSLDARIRAVLGGSIRPEPQIEPSGLIRYTFAYEQVLTEEYLAVVYPDEPPTFGGDDEPPTGSTSTSQPPGSSSSTSSTSSTTTTTLLVPTTSISSVSATGRIVEGDLDCSLRFVGAVSAVDVHYIVSDGEVWRSTMLPALGEEDEPEVFDVVDPQDELLEADLIYCPGWSPLLDESGFDTVITPGTGAPEDRAGVAVERFDLTLSDLETVGILPPDASGILVDRFTVWIGGEGPWIVAVDLAISGTTESMDAALGEGFYPGADVTIEVAFEIGSINDARLEVIAPSQ